MWIAKHNLPIYFHDIPKQGIMNKFREPTEMYLSN